MWYYILVSPIINQIFGYLTGWGTTMQDFVTNFGSSKSEYSMLVILFLVFAVFMVAFTFGRSRMLVSLVSIYIAYFIEWQFPYFSFIKQYLPKIDDAWFHAGIFIVAYILVLAILFGSILKTRMSMREASFLPLVLVAVVEVGFLASISISFLPTKNSIITDNLYNFFGTPTARLVWGILPIVLLLFSRGKKGMPKAEIE